MSVERIYIGGLDPPRLSAKDVMNRLESLDDIELGSTVTKQDDDDENHKSFFHLTAISKKPTASALEIISKKYHNVKWKGCKLAVEAARPHFLERLEEERRKRTEQNQRQQQQQLLRDKELTSNEEEQKVDPSTNTIPRRLRIRKKYGDEAYHVDTKPWSVDKWSFFDKALGKFRKRTEKHQTTVMMKERGKGTESQSTMPAPLMHRAVHIRFDAESSMARAKGGGDVSSLDDDEDDNAMLVVSSDEDSSSDENGNDDDEGTGGSGSDSDSTSQSLENGKAVIKAEKQAYAWSDDDSADDSEKEDNQESENDDSAESLQSEEDEESEEQGTPELNTEKETLDDWDSVSSESSNTSMSTEVDATKEYNWSSDEISSDKENMITEQRKKQPLRPVSTADEFDAGLDLESGNSDGSDIEETASPQQIGGSDLVNDVATNLDILSSLFPGMADTKPRIPHEESGEENSLSNKRHESNKSLHATEGIMMPRFDPNDKSTQKYVVEDDEIEENKNEATGTSKMPNAEDDKEVEVDVSGEESDEGDRSEHGGEEKNNSESGTDGDKKMRIDRDNIYEESKLENVFRAARDAWQGKAQTKETSNATNQPTTGTFSFGFALGPNDDQELTTDKKGGEFSFAFDLPGQGSQNEIAESDIPRPSRVTDMDIDDEELARESQEAERRRGLLFPNEIIEKYRADFFACNNGNQIMNDLEGYRNDERDTQEWQSERQSLTLDWKRKRKHAQSRIQKRMKIR